ncbi:hypothetical protein B0H34DRAFT_688639 [Crassisporium funariophilum]|nr:hypothetical protein B0H34DRAFT_688639 [Crassisporium funariophilum]
MMKVCCRYHRIDCLLSPSKVDSQLDCGALSFTLSLSIMASELLKQIQAGKALKKAETKDRSAPVIDVAKGGVGSAASPMGAPSLPSGGGPPQLGGLFAGGMPKLKPAGQSNFAKPPSLGKPPSVPKADPPSAPTPPARNVPPKPSTPVPARPSVPPPPKPMAHAPVPPARPAPSLPSRDRNIGAPPAPAPPRRPPPPLRSGSPPSTPPRLAQPLGKPTPSVSRPVPAIPPRNANPPVTSPNRSNTNAPGRMPPPPPPRPSSFATPPSPARIAPPPPSRKPPPAAPAPPPRVRAASEAESSGQNYSPEPAIPSRFSSPSVPPRARSPPSGSPLAPPSRRAPTVKAQNGDRQPAPRRKIPSPPPTAGVHTFPVTDFPPPREFKPSPRIYNSGSQQGSTFDLGNL